MLLRQVDKRKLGHSVCSAASLPAGVSALLYLPPKQEAAFLQVCSFDVSLDVTEPEREEVFYLSPQQVQCQVRIKLQEGMCPRAIPFVIGNFYAYLKKSEVKQSIR